MRVALPDEQYDLRNGVREVLRQHAGPATLRRYWSSSEEHPSDLWKRLCDLGLTSMTAPALYGGQGFGLLDTVLLQEELGRFAVPYPVVETIGIVNVLLARHASEEVRSRWLPGVAAGTKMATVQPGWDGLAPWGAHADLVIVIDEDGAELCEPPPGTSSLESSTDPARRPARATRAMSIGRLEGRAIAVEAQQLGATVTAATLFGLSEAVLNQATEYAKDRVQFGRPIGSFQAVKHQLVDAYVGLQNARRSVWYAALCCDRGDGATEAAHLAKASVTEASNKCSQVALQVYGGLGYTWECDLHMWLKRIQVLEETFGSANDHWRALADTYFPRRYPPAIREEQRSKSRNSFEWNDTASSHRGMEAS